MGDRRPLISYDDIASPQAANSAQLGPPLPSTNQPPAKRRRTHQKAPPRRTPQHVQHWDDPGNDAGVMSYSNGASGADEYEDHAEEEEELTHEDIWDDSALIDAWNSATAEYEAYHGKTKKWKEEPVKRSPLWYNVPPSPSKLANSKGKSGKTSAAVAVSQAVDAADSKPVDFNTFVPSHDPSLARTSGTAQGAESLADHSQSYLPGPTGPIVGQDEAFEKALSAMYWSGYWTAAYHYHGHYQNQGGPSQADGEAEDEANDEVDEVDAMMDDLIETQR